MLDQVTWDLRRVTASAVAFVLLLVGMMPAAPVSAETPGVLHLQLVRCPGDVDARLGMAEVEKCTEVVSDDGSAMVTLPDGSGHKLSDFEQDQTGGYIIESTAGLVTVSGLAPTESAYMISDGNAMDEDSSSWYVEPGSDISAQVYYYDFQDGQLPFPVAPRNDATINLYLLLCENGKPESGTDGCEVIEDDGRANVNTGGDAAGPLDPAARTEDGAYILTGNAPSFAVTKDGVASDNGYDTWLTPDSEGQRGYEWYAIEGGTRNVYVYYTPGDGTVHTDAGEAEAPVAPSTGGLITQDGSLPPAKPAQESPSMGGPDHVGTVYVHLLKCAEGVAPSIEACTETIAEVGEITITFSTGETMALSEAKVDANGVYEVTGVNGETVFSGMQPISTDRAITNADVLSDSEIQVIIDSGNEFDLYVIYYFE